MPQEPPTPETPENAQPQAAPAAARKSTRTETMEFKPVVKYAGIGVAFLLLLGVEYATYSVGYDRGYGEATASGRVQNEVNAAAVENLAHFMQMAVAGDKELIAAARNYKQTLSWIREPAVRREAEWSLTQALIDRGLVTEGTEMVSALIPGAPKTPIWARRAKLVAGAFAKAGQEESALAYYRLSADMYGSSNQTAEQVAVLSEMVELLAASPSPAGEVIATLDALQQDVASSETPAKELRATILAYMGSLHRRCGNKEESLRCFQRALDDMPADMTPELAGAAVCYGMALLEKGETAKAEKLLRSSVSRIVDSPAEISFQVSALRELARLEQERGNVDEALGLLYRAEGAATGRIPADNPFWTCLFDQRGWINLLKQLYDSAYADFAKAIACTEQPDLLAQPLEGTGRCCIALGKSDEAIETLTRAAELRRRHMPAAKEELGRVLLLLGQACDMAGRTQDSTTAYEQAVELLPHDSADRHLACMSLAYAYSQERRWSDACALWESLQSVFADDAARREEVSAQLALCRRNAAPQETPAAPEAEPAPATSNKNRPRRPRRR